MDNSTFQSEMERIWIQDGWGVKNGPRPSLSFLFLRICLPATLTFQMIFFFFFCQLESTTLCFHTNVVQPKHFLMFCIGISLDGHLKINCTENFE